MNAKYYARKLERIKLVSTWSDVIVALAASSAFTGLAVWKLEVGRNAFSLLLAGTALVSALRPVLRLSDKIDRYSKLRYGYLEIYYRLEWLLADLRTAGHLEPDALRKASEIVDRFRTIELEGDAYQDPKKLLKYQDEVEAALPTERMWLPSE